MPGRVLRSRNLLCRSPLFFHRTRSSEVPERGGVAGGNDHGSFLGHRSHGRNHGLGGTRIGGVKGRSDNLQSPHGMQEVTIQSVER